MWRAGESPIQSSAQHNQSACEEDTTPLQFQEEVL
jgi:hypothetical protein